MFCHIVGGTLSEEILSGLSCGLVSEQFNLCFNEALRKGAAMDWFLHKAWVSHKQILRETDRLFGPRTKQISSWVISPGHEAALPLRVRPFKGVGFTWGGEGRLRSNPLFPPGHNSPRPRWLQLTRLHPQPGSGYFQAPVIPLVLCL